MGGAKTYLEDHHYISGCGAQNLKECLEEESGKQGVTRFGWLLCSTVVIIVTGEIYKEHCVIEVQSIFSFIPNNYPFISIDDAGRVVLEPLPAYKRDWWIEDRAREWKSPELPNELSLQDISDELLAPFPSARIKGYLGDKPRPRSCDSPFRANGPTLLNVTSPLGKLLEDAPPLITNVEPIFCYINSASMGLDDLNEVKIGGMELSALPIPWQPLYDLTLVLFSVECHVNQSKSSRMIL